MIPRPRLSPLRPHVPGALRFLGLVLVLIGALAAAGWVRPAHTPLVDDTLYSYPLSSASISPSVQLTTTLPLTNTLFFLQPGTPAAIPNFLEPDKGCAWAGVGGQVFDRSGAPVTGMMVRLTGTWQGTPLSKYAVTNSSQGFGPGGYDIYLGSQPQAARSLTLQVVDTAGKPRSVPVPLATVGDCTGNLLVVNLREWVVKANVYYPVIRR